MIFRSKKDTNHGLQMIILKYGNIYKKTSYIHHQRSRKRKNCEKILRERAVKMFKLEVSHFFKLKFYRSVVMDSFFIELVSNASFDCYPNFSLSSFQIFYQNKYILKKNERLLFCYPSLYQNVTEGKFTFIDGRESHEEKRKIQPMHIEPGLYLSFVDLNVAMNDKVQKRIGAQK